MKTIKWMAILVMAMAGTGCHEGSGPLPDTGQTGTDGTRSVCFSVTRAGGSTTAAPSAFQLTRAFVAERAQEHNSTGTEVLHCAPADRAFLDAPLFLREGLRLQWYKFAFVCVPHIPDADGMNIDGRQLFSDIQAAEGTEQQTTCDFARLWVDYAPLLDLQTVQPGVLADATYDFHLYRGVVNRWTTEEDDPDVTAPETVVMKRITGLLHIDMGVLSDQFEHPVSKITVHLNTPERAYVYDNATLEGEGSVITQENRLLNYTFPVSPELRTSETEHCIVELALLPGALKYATLTVTYTRNGAEEEKTFSLAGNNAQTIEIKPNTRTTVLFNGMYSNEFEVRYAGFNDDGDDAPQITVPGGDAWTDVTTTPNP